MLFMVCIYPLLCWRGVSCGYELPNLYSTIWGIVLHVISVEIYFYYGHRYEKDLRHFCITFIRYIIYSCNVCRVIHHPRVYKYLHKIHHEWTAPVGITAFYSHPVEHFAVNLASIVAGTVVSGCHLSTAWLWYFLYIFTSTLSHSGYHLPFLPSPEAHDFHHSKYVYVYMSTWIVGCMGVAIIIIIPIISYSCHEDFQYRPQYYTILYCLKHGMQLQCTS